MSKTETILYSGSTAKILSGIESSSSTLKLANYYLTQDGFGQLFLNVDDPYVVPEKIYGDLEDLHLYVKSVNLNKGNTGIYLLGEKGSGKTLQAKYLCSLLKRPVIHIGDASVLENPNIIEFFNYKAFSDVVIFIDEFEKLVPFVSHGSYPPAVLNLIKIFDGALSNKLTFILTANEDNISDLFKNRLNRIKYKKIYKELSDEEIVEVIEDRLTNIKYKESLFLELSHLDFITYDILICIIDDVNLLDIDPAILITKYNLYSEPSSFTLTLRNNNDMIELNSSSTLFFKLPHDGNLISIQKYTSLLYKNVDMLWANFISNDSNVSMSDFYMKTFASINKQLTVDKINTIFIKHDTIVNNILIMLEEIDTSSPEELKFLSVLRKELREYSTEFNNDTIAVLKGDLSYSAYCSKHHSSLLNVKYWGPFEERALFKEMYFDKLKTDEMSFIEEYSDLAHLDYALSIIRNTPDLTEPITLKDIFTLKHLSEKHRNLISKYLTVISKQQSLFNKKDVPKYLHDVMNSFYKVKSIKSVSRNQHLLSLEISKEEFQRNNIEYDQFDFKLGLLDLISEKLQYTIELKIFKGFIQVDSMQNSFAYSNNNDRSGKSIKHKYGLLQVEH